MKKVIILSLILLFLFFNITGLKSTFAATTTFKEGIYNFNDFDASPSNVYTVKNISKKDSVAILIYNQYDKDIQTIRLESNSIETDEIKIEPNNLIVVAGDGEVTITPKLS